MLSTFKPGYVPKKLIAPLTAHATKGEGSYHAAIRCLNNKNFKEATNYFERAYLLGCRRYDLGVRYLQGLVDNNKDIFNAVECFEACVSNNSEKVPAALALGNIYLHGIRPTLELFEELMLSEVDKHDFILIPADYKKAFEYFVMAYDEGNGSPEAPYKLGLMYQRGIVPSGQSGITEPPNLTTAKHYFNIAKAMVAGQAEKEGIALHQKIEEALKSLEKSKKEDDSFELKSVTKRRAY